MNLHDVICYTYTHIYKFTVTSVYVCVCGVSVCVRKNWWSCTFTQNNFYIFSAKNLAKINCLIVKIWWDRNYCKEGWSVIKCRFSKSYAVIRNVRRVSDLSFRDLRKIHLYIVANSIILQASLLSYRENK